MDSAFYLSNDHASLDAVLRRFCVLPNPVESEEQAERRAHRDLEQLDTATLQQELGALRLWLALQSSPHPWFRERVARLRGVLRDGH